MELPQILLTFGVPSAITGFGVWWVKRRIESNEKKSQEQQQNIESLVLMIIQSSKANQIGIQAIAKAVQRIPDAHCNGDMTEALAQMEKIQEQEREFLVKRGIKYLFE